MEQADAIGRSTVNVNGARNWWYHCIFLNLIEKLCLNWIAKMRFLKKKIYISEPRAYLHGVKGVKAVFQVSKEGFGFIVALKWKT